MAWKAKEPMKPEVALERLEAMCARAEHCRAELQQKLYGWMVAPAHAERILATLEKNRFLTTGVLPGCIAATKRYMRDGGDAR